MSSLGIYDLMHKRAGLKPASTITSNPLNPYISPPGTIGLSGGGGRSFVARMWLVSIMLEVSLLWDIGGV